MSRMPSKRRALTLRRPISDDPSADPVAGVYFNNLSFSKLDWYLNADTQIGQGSKNGDGTCSYRITVTLTNIMTQEEAGKPRPTTLRRAHPMPRVTTNA